MDLLSKSVILLAGLVVATPALASDVYPARIQLELSLAAEPPCTTCHASDLGGFGTVVQPFGQSMMARGLVAGDEQSLVNALAALSAEGTDSDGDGVGDIDELIAGTDPNSAGGLAPPPEYGCLGNVTAGTRASPWPLLPLAAFALLRRRAGCRSPH